MSDFTLDRALQAALAHALGVTEEEVVVTVAAPGWDERSQEPATVAIRLTADADESQEETDPGPAGTTSTGVADDADRPAAEDADRSVAHADQREPVDRSDGSTGDDNGTGEYVGPTPEELDQEAETAADFLEGLLDAFDLPGDLRIRVLDDHAEVEIVQVDGGALIGRRGQTLEAIQELARCALQREYERRTRVTVDVEGYRIRRLEKLEEKALEAIEAVRSSGEPQRLEPMDAYERKAIHRLVAQHEGLLSHSQGREPGRRIVIEME